MKSAENRASNNDAVWLGRLGTGVCKSSERRGRSRL